MGRSQRPAKSKEAKPPVARKSPDGDAARVRALEKQLAEALAKLQTRDRDLVEAQEQQAATAEILRVISSSPTDVQPVFAAVATSAAGLCEAFDAAIHLVDAEVLRLVAHQGSIPPDVVIPLAPETLAGRVIRERRAMHVADMRAETLEYPMSSEFARNRGFRTILSAPLLRGAEAIGTITIRRTEVRPFSDRQIALLKTFADQAVIAIENVRLFNETKEALEQQTATSEILGVISSSPTDVQPVFEAITQSAMRLCDGTMSVVSRYDGELIHLGAYTHVSTEGVELIGRRFPMQPMRDNLHGRVVLEGGIVHIPDVQADSEFNQAISQALGTRSTLGVPMLLDGRVVGAIAVARPDVRPFTDKQIALLKTFADQAVIAIENVRLFNELQASNGELTTALDKQTATSEILRVISRSPTNLQPVFDAIVRSAVRLCGANHSVAARFDGELLHPLAFHGFSPKALDLMKQSFPMRPTPGLALGRTALRRAVVNIPDALADPEYARDFAVAGGWRSGLGVPMLRDGHLIGVIAVSRSEPGAFADEHVELLKTFADQAVIAIENVRLFTELEEKNQALTKAHAQVSESLEQQTATSEILRVISSSPTDIQPVFDAVAESAARLCESSDADIWRRADDRLLLVAHYGAIPVGPVAEFGLPLVRGAVGGRSMLEGRPIQVADVQAAGDEFPESAENASRTGFRTILSVPLIREGVAIGAISLRRTEVKLFSDRQIALLQTFADQAVIAIENVRLFKELDARNRDLTTALDQQTATSEILQVISRSQTDVQPVFDTIVGSAVRLLRGHTGALTRIVGGEIALAAVTSLGEAMDAQFRSGFPMALDRNHPHPRAIRERAVINIVDTESDLRLPDRSRELARTRGFRSWVTVPMLRRDQALGTIAVTRSAAGGFTDDEIALLQTFADQAVIAIENARLLSELQARTAELTRSVDELTALGEVSRALSSTLDVDVVLDTIVTRANDLIGADGCTIFEYDEAAEQFHLRATRNLEPRLVELARGTPLRRGDQGILGRLPSERQPVQVPDITVGSYSSPISAALIEAGYRAVAAVPLVREDCLIGALTMNRKTPGEFPPATIQLLQTFATQSALAIQNAQLFREIADKSRQLEVASQHKSEFLANMSHELRTPLNAIIGFSEVLTDRMFGDLNEKQEEYLKDIYASGTHLLSLINDILDLSKIEAGRMELELTEFDLPTAIENALMLVRERAGRRSIALHTNIDNRLGQIQADERKVRQVVLNLLSNAIKFTPEGGRIDVGAVPKDGLVEVSVSDTGVGIAPEDQEKVFEEFRQVGTAAKKVEGTGLGLTLCRKFVELHGGKISVKSELGMGSTFTFSLPLRGA